MNMTFFFHEKNKINVSAFTFTTTTYVDDDEERFTMKGHRIRAFTREETMHEETSLANVIGIKLT